MYPRTAPRTSSARESRCDTCTHPHLGLRLRGVAAAIQWVPVRFQPPSGQLRGRLHARCHHQSPAGRALFHGHRHGESVGRIPQLGSVVLRRRHLARGLEPHPELRASLPTQPRSQRSQPPACHPLRMRLQQPGSSSGAGLPASRSGRVWRMGYGLQYGPVLPSTYAWLRSNPRPTMCSCCSSRTCWMPCGRPVGRPSSAASPRDASFSRFWTAAWPRRIRTSTTSVGNASCANPGVCNWGMWESRAFKLVQMRNRQPRGAGAGNDADPGQRQRPAPDQRYSSIRTIGNTSRAWYDAAIASLSLPRWKGLHADASFWFGKSLDYAANFPDQEPWEGSTASGSMKGTKT